MIKSFVGPMFSGKSDALIDVYNKIWNKELIIAFKPKSDSRDGNIIKSKNTDEFINAIEIENISEILEIVKNGNYRTVFIDEAQLLKGDVSLLVDMSVVLDIDFYIAGLNMTSEQVPFGLMGDILAVSDSIINITGSCEDCNRPSIYTFYTGFDKDGQVKIGDTNYVSLCPRCLKLRRENKKMLKRYLFD